MDFRFPTLPLVLLLSAATGLARERVEERTFPTGENPVVNIGVYRGTITVESSDENVVHVKITATATFEQDEAGARALGHLALAWHQDENTVTLAATNPSESRVHFSWQDDERLEVAIAVTVPRGSSLKLVSGNGAIRIGDITGSASVKTGAGLIFCRHVDGDLTARDDNGDIVVSRCNGDVDLGTKRGFIRTGRIGGKATVATVNGDIEILSVSRGLVASTNAGDITAGFTRQFSGETSIRANGGNVTLKIDPSANVEIEASSVWGQVRTMETGTPGLPLVTKSGGLGRHALVARVNAGGTIIEARASGGQVNLTGEIPPFS
jgi:hypothetical protein